MNVFLNLWGGEGYLSGASVLALASVGIYDGIKDAKGQPTIIKYGCYDFASPQNADLARCNEMYDAYKKYYCKMISGDEQNEGVIEKQPVTIQQMTTTSTPQTLETKYNADRELLAYGCSESDITTNLKSGIYGKPWVGEAYYADSKFGSIYNGDKNSMVVINCGGYKGGGTAATFIPLENEWDPYKGTEVAAGVSASKFDVIVGPSTQFNRFVKYPNTGIYSDHTYDNGVDLFEIPKVIKILNEWGKTCGHHDLHEANIAFLEKAYKDVEDSEQGLDRRSLNPINYMPRFVDRVASDESIGKLNACFINLKPNLIKDAKGYFNYDVTSPAFSADNQKHQLHITNLLSAVEVQEIARNHGMYNEKGQIYTFQQPGATFTLNGVFGADDEKKILRFIIFSLFFTEYLCNVFNDITIQARADATMLEKWAQTKNVGFPPSATVCMPPDPKGTLNEQFANAAKKFFVDMAHEYIKPTLQAFLDFHDTCPDVDFFSKTALPNLPNGAHGVVEDIINKIKVVGAVRTVDEETSSAVIKERTESRIAALVIDKFNCGGTYDAVLAHIKTVVHVGILKQYQASFPEMGRRQLGNRKWPSDITPANVEEKAHDYCIHVIKYTYEKICELFV